MTIKCTIVCRTDSRDAIVSFINARGLSPRHDHAPGEWKTLECGEWLRLTSLVFGAPMDNFSKTLLGMHSYFRRGSLPVTTVERQASLKRIAATELFVGVVLNETTSSIPDFVFELAKHVDGWVFDGACLLDGDGEVVLEPNTDSA